MNSSQLENFDHSSYYRVKDGYQPFLDEDKIIYSISPLPPAGDLIANYYLDKYQAKINIQPMSTTAFVSFFEKMCQDKMQDPTTIHREAFLFDFGKSHTHPFVYIKEQKTHAFLYLNSITLKQPFISLLKQLNEKTNATVFAYQKGFQNDGYSCHTAGIAQAAKAIAINLKTNKYLIANESFIELLIKRSQLVEGNAYLEVRLPPQLLFPVQDTDFFKRHQGEEKIEFNRKKYTLYSTINDFDPPYYFYLQTKSLKFANIMEIQFYLQQLKEKFQQSWTIDMRNDFVKKAKMELKTQGYVKKTAPRKGLQFFTENYMTQVAKATLKTPEDKEKSSEKEKDEVIGVPAVKQGIVGGSPTSYALFTPAPTYAPPLSQEYEARIKSSCPS